MKIIDGYSLCSTKVPKPYVENKNNTAIMTVILRLETQSSGVHVVQCIPDRLGNILVEFFCPTSKVKEMEEKLHKP